MGLIYPIMPELFFDPVHGLIVHHTLHFRNVLYGLSFAFFPLAAFFGMPIIGKWSDRFGRRKLLLISLLGIVLGYVLGALSILAHAAYVFLFSRLVAGFFSGTGSVVNAAVADISQGGAGEKSANFRWPILASVLGFIIGPLIGALVGLVDGSFALMIPFSVACFISILNLVLIFFVLPEMMTTVTKRTIVFWALVKESVLSVVHVVRTRKIRLLNISYALFQFSAGLYIQSLSLFLMRKYAYGTGEIGIFFSMMGVAVVFSMLVFQPLISALSSQVKLSVSIFFAGIALGCIGLSVHFTMGLQYAYWVWVLSFIYFLFFPVVTKEYLVIYSGSSNDQGLIMGVTGQIYAITWFIAGILVGYISAMGESVMLYTMGLLCCMAILVLMLHFIKQVAMSK